MFKRKWEAKNMTQKSITIRNPIKNSFDKEQKKIEICITNYTGRSLIRAACKNVHKNCKEGNITKYRCKDGFNLSVKKQFCSRRKEKKG